MFEHQSVEIDHLLIIREIALGEVEIGFGQQGSDKGLSQVENKSSAGVLEIGSRNGRGKARAFQPGRALSADLEFLVDPKGGRRGVVLKLRIRSQAGSDFAGTNGLDV